MNTLSLSIHDLSVYNDEPRMLDLRLAEVLEFSEPRAIRKIIQRNMPELELHGEVCATMAQTSDQDSENRDAASRFQPKRGPAGAQYLLNAGQSLVVCMLSRTDRAAEVRKMVIDVFLAWYRGHPEQLAERAAFPGPSWPDVFTAETARAVEGKISLLRACQRLYGAPMARALWPVLGLPLPPELPNTYGEGEARDFLATIIVANLVGIGRVADLIEAALDDDENARITLAHYGIRVDPDRDGIVIANRSPALARDVLDGSRWEKGGWRSVLRRLPGAEPTAPVSFGGSRSRGTFVPSRHLDFGRGAGAE